MITAPEWQLDVPQTIPGWKAVFQEAAGANALVFVNFGGTSEDMGRVVMAEGFAGKITASGYFSPAGHLILWDQCTMGFDRIHAFILIPKPPLALR